MKEEKIKKKKKRRGLITFIVLVGVLSVYSAFSIYFKDRFYFGSAINSIDVSGKTVDEVNSELSSEVDNYSLTIEGRGGTKEEIKGSDIGLYNNIEDNSIQGIKDTQNPIEWIKSIFTESEHEVEYLFQYDEDKLRNVIDKLPSFNENQMVKPQNPTFKYSNYKYEIIPEDSGSYVNKEKLFEEVSKAIVNGNKNINLEKENCYETPKYTSSSQEVVKAKDILDKYVKSKITYKFVDKSVVIDGAIINEWLSVDDSYNVQINNTKATNYINTLTSPYKTVGKTRNFKASTGSVVSVSGGDYGRTINNSSYVEELISAIKDGKEITREYNFSQGSSNNGLSDIGNTYVEINLTKQYIWFYKNGSLVTESSIVTGDLKNGWGTPQGVYKLKSRELDRILRGPGYASPVTFWMPFNGGIGLHDATWRDKFGGTIYKNNGSHGCVNLPYNVAKAIYNNISVGDPIVCYFE